MEIKRTLPPNTCPLHRKIVSEQQDPKDFFAPLPVTPEELAYIKETERAILSNREHYSWESVSVPSASSIKPNLPQCADPDVFEPSYTNIENTTSSSTAALSPPIIPDPTPLAKTDADTELSSALVDGTTLLTEEEEHYLDDDSIPQFYENAEELLGADIWLGGYEGEADHQSDNQWNLEGDLSEEEIPDLIEIYGENDSAVSSPYDLLGDYEPEEYDADAGRQDFDEVEISGKVSKKVRAQQTATDAGQTFGLSNQEILILARIFEESGWAATRAGIERELARGATIDEIYLAAEAKKIWQEHVEYGCGCRTYFKALSWPMALTLVRSFSAYPDPDEIRNLLTHIFDHWRQSPILPRVFWPFSNYLSYRLGVTKGALDIMPEWLFEHHPDDRGEMTPPPSSLDITWVDDPWSAKYVPRLRASHPEY